MAQFTTLSSGLLVAYSWALFTSMAAMELFGWSLFLAAFVGVGLALNSGVNLSEEIRRFSLGPWFTTYGLLLLFGSLAGALLQDRVPPGRVIGDFRWILLLFAFNFLLRRVSNSRWQVGFKRVLWAVLLAGLYGIFQFSTGIELIRSAKVLAPAGGAIRATGFFSMPLTYGGIMAVALCLSAAYFFVSPNKKTAWLAGVAAAAAFGGVISSLNRGAWLGLFLAGAVTALLTLKKRGLMPILAGSLGVAFTAALNSSVRARILGTLDFSSATYTDRFALWRVNWEIFKDNPVFGVGYGQSRHYVLEYYEKLGIHADFVSHAHNIYFQMLSTTGLVGFASFLALSIGFMAIAWRLWRKLPKECWPERAFSLGSFAALLTFHIAGLTESNFTDAEVNHVVIFIWANIAALHSRHSQALIKPEQNRGL